MVTSHLVDKIIFMREYFGGLIFTLLFLAAISIFPKVVFAEIQFTNATFEVSENAGIATISVERVGNSEGVAVAEVFLQAGTATLGEDFNNIPPSFLVWQDGELGSRSINITVIDDNVKEEDETVLLELLETGSQTPLTAELLIKDSTTAVLPETGEKDTIKIISGDIQTGKPDSALSQFEVQVSNSDGSPLIDESVSWSFSPSNSGALNEGASTVTDAQGRSRNTFVLNVSTRVLVRASVNDGDSIVTFVINGSFPEEVAPPELVVAKTLDNSCEVLANKSPLTAAEQDLLNTCNQILQGEPEEAAEALRQLAPEEVIAQGSAVIETANLQVTNINSRLNILRLGQPGLSLSGLSINIFGQRLPGSVMTALSDYMQNASSGGSAGEPDLFRSNPWGAFINGTISFGDRDETANESALEYDSQGVTTGLDYRLNRNAVIGGAIGFSNTNSDFSENSGSLEAQGFHLSAYGTYYQANNFYLDGVLKLGWNQYATERRLSSDSDPLQLALGDSDGQERSLSLSGGYEWNIKALTAGSYVRLNYIKAQIDGYSESVSNPSGAGIGSVLSISKQDLQSLTAVLGGQFTYAVSTKSGVYLPQLRLELEHEFEDGIRDISARFVHDPTSTGFSIATDAPDRNYLNLGLGFSVISSGGRSGFLFYETRLEQDHVAQNWLKAGVRWEF